MTKQAEKVQVFEKMALKKVILILAVMLTVLVLAGTGYASASPPAEEWTRTYEMSA